LHANRRYSLFKTPFYAKSASKKFVGLPPISAKNAGQAPDKVPVNAKIALNAGRILQSL
jgi:hypothetical protein